MNSVEAFGVLRFLTISMICFCVTSCKEKALFQAPPRGGEATPPPIVSDSVITLVASIPYAALGQIAEAKIPATFPLGGDGHVACMNIPFLNPGHVGSHQECINKPYLDFRGAGTERVCANVPDFTGPSVGTRNQCADYHWNAKIDKDGPIQIEKSGADILVKQSLHITGKAGLGGDLAGALSLSGKSFDARVSSAMGVNFGLNNQWCPIIKVAPIGQWVSSASAELVGRNCVGIDLGGFGHPQVCAGPVNLGLADVLNSELDKHRDDIQRAAQNTLDCDTIRASIGKQWNSFSIKVNRSDQTPLYLNVEPKTAGFSGLIADETQAKIVVRVGARTVLSPTELVHNTETLPGLDPAFADQGDLEINLQAVAPYDFLKNELGASLKGKIFKKAVLGGVVEIKIEDVDLYPSNGALAVGLRISATIPGRWLDTTGWVYLHGTPVLIRGGKTIEVENLGFSTVLDNEFWTAVHGVFETEILSILQEHAKFDLSKEIDKASSEITLAISKADTPGLKVTAGTPAIELTGIHLTSDGLVATAKLGMNFSTELTAGIIK